MLLALTAATTMSVAETCTPWLTHPRFCYWRYVHLFIKRKEEVGISHRNKQYPCVSSPYSTSCRRKGWGGCSARQQQKTTFLINHHSVAEWVPVYTVGSVSPVKWEVSGTKSCSQGNRVTRWKQAYLGHSLQHGWNFSLFSLQCTVFLYPQN